MCFDYGNTLKMLRVFAVKNAVIACGFCAKSQSGKEGFYIFVKNLRIC